MKRTLRLQKDTLTELSTDELRDLGGGTLFSPQEFRIPTRERCSDSLIRDCGLSFPGTVCIPTTSG